LNSPDKKLDLQTIRVLPGVRILPVIHGSVEYTVIIRNLFFENPPSILAVELPENFISPVNKALPFADQIPIISASINNFPGQVHFIMEPLEPLVEALRSAWELKIPYHLIDAYGERIPSWLIDNFPDTYALSFLYPTEMYNMYQKHIKKPESDADQNHIYFMLDQIDNIREIHMANQLKHLAGFVSDEEYMLVVCGMKHVKGIKSLLELPLNEFDEQLDTLRKYNPQTPIDEEEPLEALLNKTERSQSDTDSSQNGIDFEISVISRESPEVLDQPGYFNSSWILSRKFKGAVEKFNRIALHRSVYRDAVNRYELESGEIFPAQREKFFFHFTRNWSIVDKKLLPDLYKFVMAARAFANDNFARIMYDILNYLPPLYGPAFPEKKITLDDLFKDSRLIRFRLKLKHKRRVPPPRLIKRFKKEQYPGQWREAWDGSGICSYPPEDIIIEDFGRYLQQKAKSVMAGTQTRTVEFTSSLLDGIDYRETIRNFHLGKIYVKDILTRGIEAGSVVIIFSEDEQEHDWKVVWWGEHNQESDMALYATPPGLEVVGPGICRCRYGGLMMTYPPGRLHDIWTDDYYREFLTASDRLLAAALEYNEKNAVVHLAAKPPSPRLQTIAGRLSQKIIYIPISTVNPVTLGKVRRFHVLDSRERRNDAGEYL